MPAFRYRLQPLLDQKIRAKESAEEALLERQREHHAALAREKELRELQRMLAETHQRSRRELLKQSGETPLSAAAILERKAFIEGLAEDLEKARDNVFAQQLVVGQCTERLEAAKCLVAECTREVDVLEKHRSKLEKRFRDELEAKEALEQDELGNVMYLMRRRNDESR